MAISETEKSKYTVKLVKNWDDYYTQRNNQYDPYNTCNVTSMIQACAIREYEFPEYKDSNGKLIGQPEDRLYYICNNDPEVLAYYKKVAPTEYNGFVNKVKDFYYPNEIHDVLSYATNKFLSLSQANLNRLKNNNYTKFTQFYTDIPLGLILVEIFNDRPIVMSGKFDGLNHIVTLVGVAYDEAFDSKKTIDYMIIDDPYGETYNYKNNQNGRAVWISMSDFIRDFKPLNNGDNKFNTYKWCHLFH